jgi:4-hydroxybenzoyl-CoA reductase subunit beta
MMRAGRFRYVAARSVADAAAALADGGPQARLLAGGTDLVPNMKRRQQTPDVLISLRRVEEMRGVSINGETSIGACTTLHDIERDPSLRRHEALFRAAAQVATPLIRSTATIGGNLCLDTRCNYYNQSYEWRKAIDFCMKAPESEPAICWVAPSSPRCWAVSSSDTAPALIALDARVTLFSKADGAREISLDALYRDDGIDHLARRPDEVLTRVRIPPGEWKSTYWKLRRRGSFDFPVLGVAAAIRFGSGGVVEEARVVLGAVASRPLLVPESSFLVGKILTGEVIDQFAERASRHAKPLDNTDFQMTWRKAIAEQYLAGVLRELRGDDPATFSLLARRAVDQCGSPPPHVRNVRQSFC